MKHVKAFTRMEGMSGIDTMVVVEIETTSSEIDPIEALKAAVTEWVNDTLESADLWEETSEDLNIGDLLSHGLEGLHRFYAPCGLESVEVLYEHSESEMLPYDTVLVEN